MAIKVSILIPIYKVQSVLTRCLDSVFNQSYSNLEYVFLDDCSPDGSLNVLKAYIKERGIDMVNVKIVSHERNLGIAVTRNDCILNATGDYVLFVDSDDWIEHDTVEKLIDSTRDGTVDIVSCDYVLDYIDGRSEEYFQDYSCDCSDNIEGLINYRISPALWKFLIKRDLFQYMSFSPDIEIGEDYVAMIKLHYYASNCACVHRFLYHYTQNNEYRYSNQRAKSIVHHVRAINEVERFLRDKGAFDKKKEREMLYRKFVVKANFLYGPFFNLSLYKSTFPEATRIWRHLPYSFLQRLRFWVGEKLIIVF